MKDDFIEELKALLKKHDAEMEIEAVQYNKFTPEYYSRDSIIVRFKDGFMMDLGLFID